MRAPDQMEMAWQNLLNHWTEAPMHQSFLDLCVKQQSLPFASQKYRKILESDPHSEVSQRMQKRIQELVIASYLSAPTVKSEPFYSKRMIYALGILGVFIVLVGLNLPGNFIGAGFPLVILALLTFISVKLLKQYVKH